MGRRLIRYHDTPNTGRFEDHRTYQSPVFTDFFSVRSSKPQDAFDMAATPSRTALGTPFRSSRGTRPSTHSIFDTPRIPLEPDKAIADTQFGHDNRISGHSSSTSTKLPLFPYATPTQSSETRGHFHHPSPLAGSPLASRRRVDSFEPLAIDAKRQYGSISSVRSEPSPPTGSLSSEPQDKLVGLQESALRTSNTSEE